jgi:hypothetical protein
MIRAFGQSRHRYSRPFGLLRMTIVMTAFVTLSLAPSSLRAQVPPPFSFVAIGDGGEPGTDLENNAASMGKLSDSLTKAGRPLGLLLFLGDNFYPNGLNRSAPDRERLLREVLGPLRPVMEPLGRGGVHAIAGNHDYYCRTINGIPFNTCIRGNEFEDSIPLWSYHYYFPVLLRRPLAEGGGDSVDLILFDSAYLIAQPEVTWKPVLDSLERLLRRSAAAPGVKWRLFMAHHSPYSVGDHGGWRRWIPAEKHVGYIGNCIGERQDPFRYAQEYFSQQDNCAPRYRHYTDSLMSIVSRSGAPIQALIAGHDHSLQLLYYPERNCSICPKVFVISGAGSKRQRVKSPSPPSEYTHPLNDDAERGASAGGFLYGSFEGGRLLLTFIDGATGRPLDMGNGVTRFAITESGSLAR